MNKHVIQLIDTGSILYGTKATESKTIPGRDDKLSDFVCVCVYVCACVHEYKTCIKL